MMGEEFPKNQNEIRRLQAHFRGLGRRSLLGRDQRTGLPRELDPSPIDLQGMQNDLMDRVREVAEQGDKEE